VEVELEGTLERIDGGAYNYPAFADWWVRSLAAFAAAGMPPDYISIQNEPDFQPQPPQAWEVCLFEPAETPNRAGYGQALAAVRAAVQALDPRPMIIGPETAGIGGSSVQRFLGGLDLSHLDGVAHHLYSGGTAGDPDSYSNALRGVATAAGGKPTFMTEFSSRSAGVVTTAWLIMNSVTVEGVSAYVYWDLVWPPPGGLVSIESPFQRANWTTPEGYIVRDDYHAVRHFSRWVDAGWQRVAAASSTFDVRAAAFQSPDGASATVVLINTGSCPYVIALDTGAFGYSTSAIYRSSGTAERTTPLGPLGEGATVMLPGRSVATVTLAPP
jgi:glucuronoarabinoxylan endo-1,4-beta-xylanase